MPKFAGKKQVYCIWQNHNGLSGGPWHKIKEADPESGTPRGVCNFFYNKEKKIVNEKKS